MIPSIVGHCVKCEAFAVVELEDGDIVACEHCNYTREVQLSDLEDAP